MIHSVIPVFLLILLLAFPSLSVEGACRGLLLWFNVVLPTLAPFIICTQMITALGGIRLLMKPFAPLLERLFQVSLSGSYILLCGLLCGYPLGARMCADFKKRGEISPKESAYLLAIGNHPSPMFLLGYVQAQLPTPIHPWRLLACLYLPVIPLSFLARCVYGIRNAKEQGYVREKRDSLLAQSNTKKPSLEDAILSACETMVIIGGYIMLFSILASWVQELFFLPPMFRAILTGLAEITTGVSSLCKTLPPDKSLIPVVGIVAFGGFSGVFQTRSVIRGSGLSVRHYMGWKVAHACLSCLTGILLLHLLP